MAQFLIDSPDWKSLQEQKQNLVELAVSFNKVTDQDTTEKLDGIIHFLDSIQDNAVESGIWTEEEIFGRR